MTELPPKQQHISVLAARASRQVLQQMQSLALSCIRFRADSFLDAS